MREEKEIMCPKCGRYCFKIFVGGSMVTKRKCNKCNKMVVYNPRYGVEIKPLENRQSSSGTRIY
jgi:hypothetical protein